MNGMLLAAGLGTRLRPATEVLAKPAIPLLNIPLMTYPLFWLETLSLKTLVVNSHHLPQTIYNSVNALKPEAQEVFFSHESPTILGSGGGILNARNRLDSPSSSSESFVVANADEVFFPDNEDFLTKARDLHFASKALATLIVKEHPGIGTQFGGVWVDANGRVLGFGKTPPREGLRGLHFTGFQILNRKVFKWIGSGEKNIFYDVLVPAILANEYVNVLEVQGDWFETGSTTDFLRASAKLLEWLDGSREKATTHTTTLTLRKKQLSRILKRGQQPGPPEPNSTKSPSFPPPSTPLTLISTNVLMDPTAQIIGPVVIGQGVRLGAHCRLQNCVLGSGVQVPDSAEIRDQILVV